MRGTVEEFEDFGEWVLILEIEEVGE